MTKSHYDYLVVGAGFAGAVCAQQLAERGKKVLVIDKRGHIGGNAYDKYDENGVLIHPYGPHIFHTNSKRVSDYLSRFTDWRFYEHRVLAVVDGKLYPIPINRTTINRLYGLDLSEEGVEKYLESVRENRQPIETSEDVALNSVGSDLCKKFFTGYTLKQWGLDLSELSPGVAARIPARANDDDRYFTDIFQFMPAEGYTKMFERMLSSQDITVQLSTKFEDVIISTRWDHMIYTGSIDLYFGYRYGKLPYRSLRFEHTHIHNAQQYQAVAQVNYPNDHDFTRIIEFKHLTGQQHRGTSITREYPQSEGEPYYPVPQDKNEILFKKYQELADKEKSVSFVGRLAEYRYDNMDEVVARALITVEKIVCE